MRVLIFVDGHNADGCKTSVMLGVLWFSVALCYGHHIVFACSNCNWAIYDTVLIISITVYGLTGIAYKIMHAMYNKCHHIYSFFTLIEQIYIWCNIE